MKRMSLYLFLFLGLLRGFVFAGDISITSVGEWGTGYYVDVFVRGNYAYCAAHKAGLDIIDIADPAGPRRLGNIDTPGKANGVHVSGRYAYVADAEGGLIVIDVANPFHPVFVGSSAASLDAKSVFIRGSYAYVAGGNMRIIDISDSFSPTPVGECDINGIPNDVFVKGNYAYVTTGMYSNSPQVSGLHIVDISNPALPGVVGVYDNGYNEGVFGVGVRGNYAYLNDGSLVVLDISNPSAPVKVNHGSRKHDSVKSYSSYVYETGRGIHINGNYAYMTDITDGLEVFDISDPLSPARVGECGPFGDTCGLHSSGNNVYLASGEGGLHVIDVSGPASPGLKGYVDTSGYVLDVDISGNYAYVAADSEGLQVLDISDPAAPEQVAQYKPEGHTHADNVRINGNYAYLSADWEGMQIIDISNPRSPVPMGNYNIQGWASEVTVRGNYAFVTFFCDGLHIVDVSNPMAPEPVGVYVESGCEAGIYIQGNYAYLTIYNTGLRVIDISDLAAPTLVGSLDTTGAKEVYVSGEYAYMADGSNGLQVVDISNPSSPTLAANYDTSGNAYGVYVSGFYAYVADDEDGLLVFDISTPTAPALAANYPTPGSAVNVRVNGDYVYVSDGDGGILHILKVYSPSNTPVINLNRRKLGFASAPGVVTDPQVFCIDNSGGGTLNWSVSDDLGWLCCSHSTGMDNGSVSVSVDAEGLDTGTYFGTVTVTAPNAINSPQTVSVILNVYGPGEVSGPFGEFATPSDGTEVMGSVPVTGWVLDDIGVRDVQIFREEGDSMKVIGDAVFVEGARPDVEGAYPWTPMNYKAGWGYMMLSNFLPNGGNGTFTLHAIATDLEGNRVTLGTKTITVNNADAVKPFGAIDTPVQGGTASGAGFRNQGWVLTPPPAKIPEDGSTVNVYVNGVFLGHPAYNIYREDIASLFPGYANSDGALAYFDFDTAVYANGIHTIQWTAGDDAGNIEGIGSRYFTIRNSHGARSMEHGKAGRTEDGGQWTEEIPVDYFNPVGVVKGYRDDVEPRDVYPRENGIITVEIKELQRVALHLGQENISSFHYSGYLAVGDELRPLPIGSTLDRERGVFYWQPGPGFKGNYHFVFIGKEQLGNMKRKDIWICIIPKF